MSEHDKKKIKVSDSTEQAPITDDSSFEIMVSKADFKFNCAHFIAYKGFRERLHGHNYHLSVKLIGHGRLNIDGYLIDFGDIKKATRSICQSFNEYFLCPMKSEAMTITEDKNNMCLNCEDGSFFSFPKADCILLPIYHSSAEELAHYIYCQIARYVCMTVCICYLNEFMHSYCIN